LKKNKTNNVLPFLPRPLPAPEEETGPHTAYFQIGSDRFAMHMWYESLPPAPPHLLVEPRVKKKTNLVVVRKDVAGKQPRGKTARQPDVKGTGNATPRPPRRLA